MEVVGKCPPEPEELEKAQQRGFEKVELYTQKKHFDNIDETLETVRSSEVEVVSVHTPHVHIDDDKAYFWLADYLCSKLDAYLVFHSQYIHHTHIPKLEEMDIKSEYGYENNPGCSIRHVEENILKEGHEMVLDTAHLYMAEKNYVEEIERILEEYGDQINLIHLCDSTKEEDGLAFGKGEMDMEKTAQVIDNSEFEGTLVLEVMPKDQKEAREKLEEYIN
jgi:sugar phosphate isomerase/epimerase